MESPRPVVSDHQSDENEIPVPVEHHDDIGPRVNIAREEQKQGQQVPMNLSDANHLQIVEGDQGNDIEQRSGGNQSGNHSQDDNENPEADANSNDTIMSDIPDEEMVMFANNVIDNPK